MTHNPQPLHIDAEFASKSQHGQILVNSLYTLGLVIGISVAETTLGTTIGNLGMENVEFPNPVFIGDTIRVKGVWGIVQEVHLSHTVLTNEDGEIITIPNKHIVGEIIHNSQADTVLELSVGIAYDSDIDIAIEAVRRALLRIEGLSLERVSQIGVARFGDSAIEIEARVWVQTRKFHEARYEANYAINEALQKNGINIPYPQRVVRVITPRI